MKRILFITPSKSIGGTNSSLSSIINHLNNDCKIDVLLMSTYGEGQYEFLQSAITCKLLDAYITDFKKLSGFVKFLAVIIKLIKKVALLFGIPIERIIYKAVARKLQKKYNFDYVVGFSEGRAMKLASEFNDVIKFTWIHCEYDRAVPLNVDELSFYSRFNKIVCVSKFTRDLFANRYPSLASNTMYIYNLLDVNRILTLANEEIDDDRFSNSLYTIISVGRIDPVKGFSNIPHIANTLLEKRIDFTWYIIGGPCNTEYQSIQKEIDKYGLAKRVILLGAKSNPYPYFKKADLYVSTSLSEACPMVFNEAKLLGLPIVSTNYGSAYEFVHDHSMISSIDELSEIIYMSYINSASKLTDICYSKSISWIDAQERNKIEKIFSL